MRAKPDACPEAQALRSLAQLRALKHQGDLPADERIVSGIYLSVDPDSDTSAQVSSVPGQLMHLRFRTGRAGRWLSLNIELGDYDLSGRAVCGLMCRTRAPETLTLRPCLRSGIKGGFHDEFFAKRVISYREESTHADLMLLDAHPEVARTAPWRELILFLPPDIAQMSIMDLAVFGA